MCAWGQNQTENSGGGRWTVAVGREERRRAHITLRVGRVGRVVHHHLQPCEAVCVVEDQSGREVLAEAEAAPRDIVAGCRVAGDGGPFCVGSLAHGQRKLSLQQDVGNQAVTEVRA